MKPHRLIYLVLSCCLLMLKVNIIAADGPDRSVLFDSGWRFHRGGAQGAESPSFDDTKWRTVDLPHDWSIEDLPGSASPFSIDAISQVSGGFTTGGTGWYRKTFKVPSESANKRLIIMFEGVYMNAEVWVNGEMITEHPYGYTSFWMDITGKVKQGKTNLVAVKVRNEGENSRWYSGSGIYRHVWLYSLSPLHIKPWGVSITTPEITATHAGIRVQTIVTNDRKTASEFRLVTKIFNQLGVLCSQSESQKKIDSGKEININQFMSVDKPELWSVNSPVLYKAISEVYVSDSISDNTETTFGIRSVSFDAMNGLLLNGNPLKLKGGCIHNDNGIIGSRAYDRAEERRIQLLKSSGFNAIRSAHNPPSPALLDACDRYGLLVIDESFDMWNEGKNPSDYHLYFNDWWKKDIESMIFRDRNHPSVIMWSIGNEIPDRSNPDVQTLAQLLGNYVRQLDPVRPVTSAVNNLSENQDQFFAALDIAGYNYAAGGDHNMRSIYETDHDRLPERIMVGTESYPLEAFDSWMGVSDHPWVIGDFVWTAYDYIGEASIGWRGYDQKQDFFPWNLAYCGDLDICGWKRPQSYYRDALWNTNRLSLWVKPPKPSFELNPERQSWSKWHWLDAVSDWNWQGDEAKTFEVTVYSSCKEVELFLNDKSLGIKSTDRSTKYLATWNVPYQPGILKAVGTDGKTKVAEALLRTSGQASKIRLTADKTNLRANGEDLTYITIELTDNEGNVNPKADNNLYFEISGPGTIEGAGNGNPVSIESYQMPEHKAWHGKCLVVIKSGAAPGKIVFKVKSQGFENRTIDIDSN